MANPGRRPPFVDIDDEDASSDPEALSDSSFEEYEVDLQSMTGKGIKRLCTELIELKRASEEDFLKNVYSNYPTFVRAFKELGVMKSELMNLKQQVSTQRQLVQILANNISLDIVSDIIDSEDEETKDLDFSYSEDEETKDLDFSSPRTHIDYFQEKLDVFISEHQVDEALFLLQIETSKLRKLQTEDNPLSPDVVAYTSIISDRRIRLVDQLASVAEHPRVAAPELQKALSKLHSLGEDDRANFLLLKYYRSRLASHIHEFQCSKQFWHATYMMEFAKVIFSVISEAARSFVLLNGEASPYTSEFIGWAKEETEAFGHNFIKFVKYILEMTGGFSVSVEVAKAAVSFCTLLNPQRIYLLMDLTNLIRPCMEEAFQMHMDHLHKEINTFTSTDTWVLGKYFTSKTSAERSSLTGTDGKLDYYLLSSGGRKFATLMQALVDDFSPLLFLQMEHLVLEGLADLSRGYICTLERAIPICEDGLGNDFPRTSIAKKLPQQIALLVTSSTVVQIFPIIASGILNQFKTANNQLLVEHVDHSLEKELDVWTNSIAEASDRLTGYFSEQFVNCLMSDEYAWTTTLESIADLQSKCRSQPDLTPSFAFQTFFLWLRNLENLAKSVIAGEDGMLKKLLKGLMKAMIVWLSNNLDFWKGTAHGSGQCSCFEQFHLDMDFLVEIARVGGYFSDDLLAAVMNLLAQIEDKFMECGPDTKGAVADDDDEWSSNAAKAAIEKLLEIELAKSISKKEPTASSGENFMQKVEDARPDNVKDNFSGSEKLGSGYGASEDSVEEPVGYDVGKSFSSLEQSAGSEYGSSVFPVEEHITGAEINSVLLNSLENLAIDAKISECYDIAGRDKTGTAISSKSEEVREEDMDRILNIPRENPAAKLDNSTSGAAQLARRKFIDVTKTEDLALKLDLLEISEEWDAHNFCATMENSGPDESSGIEDGEEADVKALLAFREEVSVGKSDDSVQEAAQSIRGKPIDIAETQTLPLELQFLDASYKPEDQVVYATSESTETNETDEIEDTEDPDLRSVLMFYEEESGAKLDGPSSQVSQLWRENSTGRGKTQNLELKLKLLDDSDDDDDIFNATRVNSRTDETIENNSSKAPYLALSEEESLEKLFASVNKTLNLSAKFKLLEVSDNLDAAVLNATRGNTGANEVNNMGDLDIAEALVVPDDKSVKNVDVVSVAAQSVGEKPTGPAKTKNLKFKLPAASDELDGHAFEDKIVAVERSEAKASQTNVSKIGAVETREIEDTEESDVEELMMAHEVKPVRKLGASLSRSTQSARRKPKGIAKRQNLAAKSKLLDISDSLDALISDATGGNIGTLESTETNDTEEQDLRGLLITSENSGSVLYGAAGKSLQSAREKQLEIPKTQHLAAKFNLFEFSERDIKAVENSGIKAIEETDVKGPLNSWEVELLGKLDSSACTVTQSEREEHVGSTRIQNLEANINLFDAYGNQDAHATNTTKEHMKRHGPTEAKDTEELDERSLLIIPEEEFLGKLDAFHGEATQPAGGKPTSTAKTQNLVLGFDPFEVSDYQGSRASHITKENMVAVETSYIQDTVEPDLEGLLTDSEEEYIVELDKYVSEATQPEKEDHAGTVEGSDAEEAEEPEMRESPEKETTQKLVDSIAQAARTTSLSNLPNLPSIDEFIKISDNLNAHEFDSSMKGVTALSEDPWKECAAEEIISVESDKDYAKSVHQEKPIELGIEDTCHEANGSVTATEECVAVTQPEMSEVQGPRKKKVPPGNDKQRFGRKSSDNQSQDKSNDLEQPKRKRERPKSVSNVERSGKVKRGLTTPRPRWT